MLKPTDIESLKGKNSRYAVVLAVAKRARDINDHSISEHVVLEEKTVSMAIADLKDGKYKIVMPED